VRVHATREHFGSQVQPRSAHTVGYAKIPDLQCPFVSNKDVRRLDVVVNDALLVDQLQHVGQLAAPPHNRVKRRGIALHPAS
jgi:hypothetical protein